MFKVVHQESVKVSTHVQLSRSTNEEGGDTTIPSPGKSLKQPLPGIGLHDPLHGRQACPEFNSFHQGVGQICPWEGLFSCRPLPKRGQICDIPAPAPQSLKDSTERFSGTLYAQHPVSQMMFLSPPSPTIFYRRENLALYSGQFWIHSRPN